MSDTIDDTPSLTEVAQLLAGIDQVKADFMMQAFQHAAAEVKAHNPEAMWAIAMLQARMLANAQMGSEQHWVAHRFFDMVRIAIPAMILEVEQVRRQREGELPHDA